MCNRNRLTISDEAKLDLKSMFRLDLKEELERILGRPLTDEELGIDGKVNK